jgi:sirohydrochlorin ferrochelatase
MTRDERTTGIILFAHGSSVQDANRGVHDLAERVEREGPYPYVRAAFLELADPALEAAIAAAAKSGLRRIVIIPYFLTMGIHLQRDLPRLVEPLRQRHPGLQIEVGPSLEGHPQMPGILLGLVREVVEPTKAAR